MADGKADQPRKPAAFGFEIACFPVKIKGASAGWSRAVAIFEAVRVTDPEHPRRSRRRSR